MFGRGGGRFGGGMRGEGGEEEDVRCDQEGGEGGSGEGGRGERERGKCKRRDHVRESLLDFFQHMPCPTHTMPYTTTTVVVTGWRLHVWLARPY